MFPELFRIPGLDIPVATYGVLLALGFMMALWMTAQLAARDSLPKARIYDLGLYILASSLVGAKLLMVITEWNEAGGNLERVFSFDFLRSGGVFYGGLVVAIIVSIFLMRRWKLPWRLTADAFAPGIAIGHAIGRLGCFAAGCCWGKPTSAWLGIHFTDRARELTGVPVKVGYYAEGQIAGAYNDPVYLVPTQLIEAILNLGIFFILLWLRKRRRFEGQVIYAYLMLYGIARFTIEFWRDDPRGQVLMLSTSQFISIIMFLVGFALTLYFWPRRGAAGKEPGARGQEPVANSRVLNPES
jgi:phosphatidylglycerol:prolipoprotein diacylglycerol transferase